jgi:lipid-A-disaccharide synthase
VPRLRSVRQLAVILPFEEEFFRSRGVAARFVGHPLRDRPPPPPRGAALSRLGLDPARPTLGIFPGSRVQEVRRLWPVFRDTARRVMAARPDVQAVVAATPRAAYPDPGPITLHAGDPETVFAAATAGLCKSGTTTLEAALADVPMVIAYRLNALSYAIARRMLLVEWVGLVNLVAGSSVAPEFLQSRATPAALSDALLPLLDATSPASRQQRDGLALVRQRLGKPGAAGRVAELAEALLA